MSMEAESTPYNMNESEAMDYPDEGPGYDEPAEHDEPPAEYDEPASGDYNEPGGESFDEPAREQYDEPTRDDDYDEHAGDELDYNEPVENDQFDETPPQPPSDGLPTKTDDGRPISYRAGASAGDPQIADRGQKRTVGESIVVGAKTAGRWTKGMAIRFKHKIENEDWGGEIKRGGSTTGKAIKDSTLKMVDNVKGLGNKEKRSEMWARTKAAWAKQWRLATKGLKKTVDKLKNPEKRKELFGNMGKSTTNSVKGAGATLKAYKAEMGKHNKANLARADGEASTGTKRKLSVGSSSKAISQSSLSATTVDAAAVTGTEDIDYDEPTGEMEETKYQAMYNYDAGNEDELSLTKGEIVSASPADEIGWLFARNEEGVGGLIPANYVSEM